MRIVVTGNTGQVARALRERGPALRVEVLAVGRPQLDLTQSGTIEAALRAAAPDVVVSAAAYTAVDKAESEPALADAVNAAGAGAVAAAAAALGVPVVHLSTDYVFSGELDRPYREEDRTNPLGAYGQSKLRGELAVAAATPDHVILRTAWVYSPCGGNFVSTMLRLARSREVISVVADQHGSPTSALDLADAIVAVCRNLTGAGSDSALRGVFHMSGAGETTWAEFAEAIFAISRAHGGPRARVEPIPTSAYRTAAKRPHNSRLDCAKLRTIHGVVLPEWHGSVATCVARLVGATEKEQGR